MPRSAAPLSHARASGAASSTWFDTSARVCCTRQVFSAASLGGWYASQQSADRRQDNDDAPGGRRRHGARGAAEGQGLAHLHHLRLRREHGRSESTLPQGWDVDVAAACSNAPPLCSAPARARRQRILRVPCGCRLGTPRGKTRSRGAPPPPRVLERAASTATASASTASASTAPTASTASTASIASGRAGAFASARTAERKGGSLLWCAMRRTVSPSRCLSSTC